jgi:hypothetical protein
MRRSSAMWRAEPVGAKRPVPGDERVSLGREEGGSRRRDSCSRRWRARSDFRRAVSVVEVVGVAVGFCLFCLAGWWERVERVGGGLGPFGLG